MAVTSVDLERPEFDVRAEGPDVVRGGPADAPRVVVLDPYGEARHGELPLAWRSLAEDVRVEWWRLPAVGAGPGIEVLPRGLADGRPVRLVAAGAGALLAASLVLARPSAVRSVVLVDPPWELDIRSLGEVASDVVLTRPDDTSDLLPLSHPDVLAAVLLSLISLVR